MRPFLSILVIAPFVILVVAHLVNLVMALLGDLGGRALLIF